jgi:hypothetical protein
MVKIGKEDLRNSSNLSGFRTSSHMAASLEGWTIYASSPCQLNETPVYPRECILLFIEFGRMRWRNRLLGQLLMRQSLIKSQAAAPGPFSNLEFKVPKK